MATKLKITYATLKADNEELQAAYDAGLERVRSELGQTHALYVNGEARSGSGSSDNLSPIDTRVLLGKFAVGTEQDVADAISAAKTAQPEWEALGWQERVRIMRDAADLMRGRKG